MSLQVDNALCERLVLMAAQGDSAACRDLVEYLWPLWIEMLRSSRRMQLLPNAEDGIHDVAARLVEKLGQPGGRGLCLYHPWKERNPEKRFEDWLRIVTQNVMRDYVREKGDLRRSSSEEPSVKRLLNEFASSTALEELGIRPPITLAQTARELLEFARERLPPQQLAILELWLQGATFDEIAVEQRRKPEATRQSLRAALAVLRRYFANVRAVAPDD